MARETFVIRNGELVLKSHAAPLPSGPIIIRDGIDLTWHPANGKHYDSKSQFRRATKVLGCEEIGNDSRYQRPREKLSARPDVERAVAMVSQGYRPNVQSESMDGLD